MSATYEDTSVANLQSAANEAAGNNPSQMQVACERYAALALAAMIEAAKIIHPVDAGTFRRKVHYVAISNEKHGLPQEPGEELLIATLGLGVCLHSGSIQPCPLAAPEEAIGLPDRYTLDPALRPARSEVPQINDIA